MGAVDVEIIDNDYSLTKDGLTMRFLPDKDGVRQVRVRPPYWNNVGKTSCAEIGERHNLNSHSPAYSGDT